MTLIKVFFIKFTNFLIKTNRKKMKRVTHIDEHIGKKLKLRRVNLGLSQAELGKLLNITFQQIQKYEKGVNRVSGGKIYELSKVLKVPVGYFYEGIDDDTKDSSEEYKEINYNDLNKEILVISRLLGTIESKEKKRNFLDVIKNLLKFMK